MTTICWILLVEPDNGEPENAEPAEGGRAAYGGNDCVLAPQPPMVEANSNAVMAQPHRFRLTPFN
jgi:hypothetical protein